jgi:hypothetical protein
MKAIRMLAFLASVLITAILFTAIAYGMETRAPAPCQTAATAP